MRHGGHGGDWLVFHVLVLLTTLQGTNSAVQTKIAEIRPIARTTFHIAERHAQLGATSEPLSEWCDSKDQELGSLKKKLEDEQRNRHADAEQRTECMRRPTHHELKSSCLVENRGWNRCKC